MIVKVFVSRNERETNIKVHTKYNEFHGFHRVHRAITQDCDRRKKEKKLFICAYFSKLLADSFYVFFFPFFWYILSRKSVSTNKTTDLRATTAVAAANTLVCTHNIIYTAKGN